MTTIDRSGCPAPRHTHYWTYDRYRCRCPDTLANRVARHARERAGTQPSSYLDATGTRRRIQALAVEGWSITRLADLTGLSERSLRYALNSRTRVLATTARLVAVVYDRTAGHDGADQTVINRALARGWVDSYRWSEGRIDDPTAQPDPDVLPGHVDDVLVDRVLSGHTPPDRLTRAERAAAARLGRRRGISNTALAELLHVSGSTIYQLTKGAA